MGLDQYLRKRIYIGANYEHNKVEGSIEIKRDGKPVKISFNKVTEIIEEAGYWRKANHIHAWMVKNIQDGEDDCDEYYFDKEKRKELLDVCTKVLNNRSLASELLPPQAGFFFGGTELDDWYYKKVQDTIEILEPTLLGEEGDYYYSSSW